jgi:hypothetical protein
MNSYQTAKIYASSLLVEVKQLRKKREGFLLILAITWATQWRSWLRHCATRRKSVDSIPDGVTGIFHSHNPSACNNALGMTEYKTEMSTRNISWG